MKGFLLIEAVIVLGIMAILTGIVLNGAVQSRRNAAVRQGAQEFAAQVREAAGLTQGGVKDPACGTDLACSQYEVTFTTNNASYVRSVRGGGSSITYNLPPGVVLYGTGSISFEYVPPILRATGGGVGVRHTTASDPLLYVCVSSLGVVSMQPTSC